MRWLASLLIFTAIPAMAFPVPYGLNSEDRREVVRTLGLNSATKMLNNPYPLGGYSGFEVGYSVEFVSVRDMRRLGCGSATPACAISDQTEWRYSRLTIGKGLYEDVDVFFSFMPPTGQINATDYGAAGRWSFYQARFLPINVSAVVHFNQLNFDNSFVNRNFGTEIIVGVNVDGFAVYFGGGRIEAEGTFIGGPSTCENCTVDPGDSQLNGASNTVAEKVVETHTVVGLSLHYENLFAAAEVDRYRDAVYSMKVGLRY